MRSDSNCLAIGHLSGKLAEANPVARTTSVVPGW